jgi:acyl carrier protein
MNDFKQALRTALVTQFRVNRDRLDDDTGLFSGGLIDSLSVMDLVGFVEGRIGRVVPPADITMENFDSISRIVAYVQTRSGAEKNA